MLVVVMFFLALRLLYLELLAHTMRRKLRRLEKSLPGLKEKEAALARQMHLHEVAETEDQYGVWEIDLDTQTVWISSGAATLSGREAEAQYLPFEKWRACVSPQDQTVVDEAIENALQTASLQVEFRILLPSGGMRWCCYTGGVEWEKGKPRRIILLPCGLAAPRGCRRERP